MDKSIRPPEPEKKAVKSRHRMNRSSRQTHEVVHISLDIPELKTIIRNIKKLAYSVGCFNSYTFALMKMLDQNMCGFSVCLQNEPNSDERKIKVTRTKPEDENSPASPRYLGRVRQLQLEMVQKIFKVINSKIAALEAYFLREIPEIRKVFEQAQLLLLEKGQNQRKAKTRLREEPDYLPRLFEYQVGKSVDKASQFKSMLMTNIRAMRYTYCSELVFLLDSDNTIVIYDLFQRRICHQLNQWPFRTRNFILRRNLNFYNSKSLLKVEFSKFDQFLQRGDAHQKEKRIVTQDDFHDLAYISLSVRDYFQRFPDEIWFHKRGKRDKYILVFQFAKKSQLLFFNFVYKFTKLQTKRRNESIRTSERGSSMMNLSRSVSLHKQKTKKVSRLFTRGPGPSE